MHNVRSALSCRLVSCVCVWEKSLTTSGLDMVSHYIIVYRLAFLDPLIGDVNRVVLLHCFDSYMWNVCEYANGCRIISDCGSAMSCRNVPCVCAWANTVTTSGLDMVSHYIIVYRLASLDLSWTTNHQQLYQWKQLFGEFMRVSARFCEFSVMRTRNVSLRCLCIIWVSTVF